jgi:hypothetical protein
MIGLLTKAPIRFIIFTPHKTQILHVLGVTLFGVFIPYLRWELPFEGDGVTITLMMKVYQRHQASNDGDGHIRSFRVGWVWIWHNGRAISACISRGKVTRELRLSGAVVNCFCLVSIVDSTMLLSVRLDQEAKVKSVNFNRSVYCYSCIEIVSLVRIQQNGILVTCSV